MNSRNTIISVVLVIAVLGVGYILMQRGGTAPAGVVTQEGDRHYTQDTQYYTIDIAYPIQTALGVRKGADAGADVKAMQTIESTIEDIAQQFKDAADPANLPQVEKDRLAGSGIKYSLTGNYYAYSSPSGISYEFTFLSDTGGAHPNAFYKTLVFDTSGNIVALGDLFTSQDYLSRISQIAKSQVTRQLTEEGAGGTIIEEGLAPTAENFQNFVIDSDTLRIFIPPYQVAAYAAGSFEVEIPLTDLRDLLKETVQ
ncbi:DUF3298 domain-containing protein [Acetobacteraceae bacterium]|nr:DUF3298 domain-containing protein [Candidatus Parcubacteria bacterium]